MHALATPPLSSAAACTRRVSRWARDRGLFALVIRMLIAWGQRIARLGRLGNLIDRLEACTREAQEPRVADPFLGGVPLVAVDAAGAGALLHADAPGYVRSVDLDALQTCAGRHGLRLQLLALPGVFASAVRPLRRVEGAPSPDVVKALRDAFDIHTRRDFAQDPRFDRVAVPALAAQDLCEDAFLGIGRDGEGWLDVSLRVQKVLEALAASDDAGLSRAAAACSREAMARARHALPHATDRQRVLSAHQSVLQRVAAGA